MIKTCSNPKCKQTNPQDISQFYQNTNGKGGYRPKCVSCEREERRNKEDRKQVSNYLFAYPEIVRLAKIYASTKVMYLGLFIGSIFDAGDIYYVYSSIKGKYTAKTKTEGRQWLVKQLIKCADTAKNNLIRKSRVRGIK